MKITKENMEAILEMVSGLDENSGTNQSNRVSRNRQRGSIIESVKSNLLRQAIFKIISVEGMSKEAKVEVLLFAIKDIMTKIAYIKRMR